MMTERERIENIYNKLTDLHSEASHLLYVANPEKPFSDGYKEMRKSVLTSIHYMRVEVDKLRHD